jgi:hypothetical protein
LHVPREELTGILRRIPRALKRGGVFYASFKIGDGDDGRDKLGRYPAPEWLNAAYGAAGSWRLLKSDTNELTSFDETPATNWHLVMRES